MMKQLTKICVMLTLLLFLAAAPAFSQNSFYLQQINFEQDDSGTLEFMLDNTDEFYGFQADITFPAGLNYNIGDLSLNRGRFDSTYGLTTNLSGGVLHVAVYSSVSQPNPITGIDGPLMTLPVATASDFIGGEVIIENIKFVNVNDRDVILHNSITAVGVLSTSISLSPDNITLIKGFDDYNTKLIDVIYDPHSEFTVRDVRWEVSDDSNDCVTVDQNGLVKGVNKGKATIIATTYDPLNKDYVGKRARCEVTVEDPETGLFLNIDNLLMEKGSSESAEALLFLNGTPFPDVENKEIEWVSSNEKVITILPQVREVFYVSDGENSSDLKVKNIIQKGIITAIGDGEATLTVSYVDRETTLTATCKVEVRTSIESIEIEPYPIPTLYKGNTLQLEATIYPDDATDKMLIWTSSDPSVIDITEVDESTRTVTVTAKALGNSVITATGKTLTGEISETYKLKVVPTPAESITLKYQDDPAEPAKPVQTLKVMMEFPEQLIAEVLPEDTTYPTVTWNSSNPLIASVDADGLITPHRLGETTITATCQGFSATCIVTVVPYQVNKITLDPASMQLMVGQTETIKYELLPENATDKTVKWSSSDEAIATVDAEGKVTAIALGEAKITASCGIAEAICNVTVIPTPVTGISLSTESETLIVGETLQLKETVLPEDATDKTVTWSSSDESVATVSEDGKVTGVYKGSCKITATTHNGLTATCEITVKILVEAIKMQETASLYKGGTLTLAAEVIPEDATDTTLAWSSSNPAVATVDSKGVVTAMALGEAEITATASDGSGVEATCKVSVVPTPASNIELPETASLKVGETLSLDYKVLPEDTTDKTVKWSSSDEAIATVDAEGKVTAIAPGEAKITASCGIAEAICNVTVIPTPVTGISLSTESETLIVGETVQLKETVLPEDATYKTVTWSSSDESVATVSEDGKVTGVYKGTCKITATTHNGLTATCEITVKILVEAIKMQETASLYKGATLTLAAEVIPEDATDTTLAWSSSNPAVATVDSKGVITAMALGEAEITAAASDGTGVEATCKVSVVPTPASTIELPETASLKVGETLSLEYKVLPEDTTDKTVTWTSSSPTIVTVDDNGVLKGEALGEATVTVICGDVRAECRVTVVPTPVESLTVTPASLTLKAEETMELRCEIMPEDATDKTLTWTSSDPDVATITDGTVKAISVGEAIITVVCGEKRATCKVTVEATPAESVNLDPRSVALRVGETFALAYEVLPLSTTDKTIVWTSDTPAVATVNTEGVIKAESLGLATVTATCGQASATCEVNVIPTPVESLKLSASSVTLKVGETQTVGYEILPADATDKSVTWISENPEVAIVDADGRIAGRSIGMTTVTAKCGDIEAQCAVTVVPTPVESITLNPASVTLKVADTVKISYEVLPADATDKTISWLSSDRSVAVVDNEGNVTALSLGETIVTAKCGDVEATCRVVVEPTPVTGITLNPSSVKLKVGENVTMGYEVLPADATDKTVTWQSENEAIAMVDAGGRITGISLGETIVTATCGEVVATCRVTVVATPVESVTLSPAAYTLNAGETFTLNYEVLPADATDRTISWAVNDESIISVDASGYVTALAPGEATVTLSCGGKTATCWVTVNRIPVTRISLTNSTLLMKVGNVAELAPIILPSEATDKSVSFSCADTSIATVDADGMVTAIAPGTTTVTVTSISDPTVTGICTVVVEREIVTVGNIMIDHSSLQMVEGDRFTLVATVSPADATDTAVTWKSLDPAIATVSADGVVTANKEGVTVIYASASNGLTADCTVTVTSRIIEVTDIALSTTNLSLHEGQTAELVPLITPDNATNPNVSWTTADATIATVNSNGLVTAIKEGITQIIATSDNGKQAICNVTVTRVIIAVSEISVVPDRLELTEGETADLVAKVLPADATDRTVTWETGNADVATVSADGKVTAVRAGSTVIYASSSNGLTAQCAVTVNRGEILPTDITLTNYDLTIRVGHSADIIAVVAPVDVTDPSVKWESADTSIATVNGQGIITGVAVGETVITATSVNGLQARCVVKVIPDVISVESISVTPGSLEMTEGDTATLIAVVSPDNATDKTVTWKSLNRAVVIVDENGTVTATGAGETVILASSSNGKTVEIPVKVNAAPVEVTEISIPSTLQLTEGETTTIVPFVRPENATDKSVTWKSEDPAIATVDANGNLTAIAQGITVMTVTAANGVSASCEVTVLPIIISVTDIKVVPDALDMTEGDIAVLTALITPENASDKNVTWKSLNRSVAIVDENGSVTATGAGETVILASSSNGKTVEIPVIVKAAPVAVSEISITPAELLLREGHAATLVAFLRPENATDKTVTWKSDDESIAVVDADGVVTAVKVGTTIISATANNGVSATCKVTVEADVIPVENISITPDVLEMEVGDEPVRLTATVEPADATDRNVTWESSDINVATVSADGLVTAVGPGAATVYAFTSNGMKAECAVTVTQEIDVTGISLSNTELLLTEGDVTDLIAIVHPDNATDQSVTWSCDDESIVIVEKAESAIEPIVDYGDSRVIVTALKAGQTVIRVTASNGMEATCAVTVIPAFVPVTGITVSPDELEMEVGDEPVRLTATVEPADATDRNVTWESSDTNVATVSADGEVTAVGPGTATVYAFTSNGMKAECAVTVTQEIDVTGISLSNTELLLTEGEVTDLIAIVHPDNASDKSVTWSCEDETIVAIENYIAPIDAAPVSGDSREIITALKAGQTVITATASNGMTATCTVTVMPTFVPVTGITLNESLVECTVGYTCTLIATVTPDNATDKTVTWQTSDSSVATVSESGEVVTVGVGDAVIYASSSNGLTAQCIFYVNPGEVEVTGISLSNTELLMRENHTADLIAIISPFDATDKTVTWSSDDESVVTVDDKGLVTAIKRGFANVTATTVNGLTALCAVTVVPDVVPVEAITLNETDLELIEGDVFNLLATVTPEEATDKTVTWSTSNPGVATVSEFGEVTAIKTGTAVIYASTSNGLTATCNVTITPRVIEVESISLNAIDLYMMEGETEELIAIITPDNATDKSVTWMSNNPEIATVDGGIVMALKEGIATITAKSSNGRYANCAVTVKARAMTPRQLLRKGDGTTNTFVVLMDLSDSELTELGYAYVVGYTAADGNSKIIADTPLRYCHTTPEIFNNPEYDFWVFAYFENEDGEIITSNLRHLDGREEICFDPSIYGFDPEKKADSRADSGDWIQITPLAIYITATCSDEMQMGIYSSDGVQVYARDYAGANNVKDVISLHRFASGTYVVTVKCDGVRKSKRIVVR